MPTPTSLPWLPERMETERLLLRCPLLEDAWRLHEALALSRPEMQAYSASMPACEGDGIPPETCEEFCRLATDEYRAWGGFEWLMVLKSTNTLVGGIGIHSIDLSVPKGEIGYWTHSRHAGRGYMTEALRAATDFGLNQAGLRRIEASPDAANAASCLLLERAGYALEGTLRHHRADGAGALHDTRLYAIVR